MNIVKKIAASEYKFVPLFFAITFTGASMESGYYFLLPYLEGIGIAVGAFGGIAMGICYGVSLCVRPFTHLVEQGIGNYRMLVTGYASFFVSAAGVALFAHSMPAVIFWRAFAGFGLVFIGVSLTAYEREYIPENVRGRSIALITTAYSLPSLILVPPIERLVANGFYFTYIIFFPFLVAFCSLIITRLPKLGKTERYAEGGIEVSYFSLLNNKPRLFLVASMALFAFTDAAQLTFVRLAKELGLTASYFFSVSAGTILVFRVLCGKLIDVLPRRICAPACTAVTAAALFFMTTASSDMELMFYGFIFGIAMGFGYPAFTCLVLDLGGRAYVTRLAIVTGLFYSGLFFVTPIIIEFFIGATHSAAAAYRLVYCCVFLASAVIIPMSAKIYNDTK